MQKSLLSIYETNTKIYFIIFFLNLLSFNCFAQKISDFENTEAVLEEGFFKNYVKGFFSDFKAKGDPFVINGGISTNWRAYHAWGIENRQAPFFYGLNANLNINIYQLNLPFSFVMTARNTESSYPNPKEFIEALKNKADGFQNNFVRVGASPYYKWAKLHLGHRGMNFSPLTMSNLNFFGVGTELSPGKIRLAGMYGRLANAEPRNLSVNEPNPFTFDRLGYGMKVGYGTKNDFIDFVMFKAKDDISSFDSLNLEQAETNQEIVAEENLVLGVILKKKLTERLQVNAEVAGSIFTPDLTAPIAKSTFLYDERTTSTLKSAMDFGLNYQFESTTIGLQFKRIEPGYRSLGTYFFNDDIQNITGNVSWLMLKGKMQANATAGMQKNNLDNQEPVETRRMIGSLNLNYALNKINFAFNYSNYTNDVAYVLNEELDSLNAVVVSQDLGLTTTYNWATSKGNQNILTSSINMQMVTDDIDDPQQSSASQMFVANLAYNLILKETGWKLTARTNYNQNQLSIASTGRWGVGAGATKSFWDRKASTGLDANFYLNTSEGNKNGVVNLRHRFSYKLKKSHNFNLNTSWITRAEIGVEEETEGRNFSELMTTFSYAYRFSSKPEKFSPRWKKQQARIKARETKKLKEEQKEKAPIENTEVAVTKVGQQKPVKDGQDVNKNIPEQLEKKPRQEQVAKQNVATKLNQKEKIANSSQVVKQPLADKTNKANKPIKIQEEIQQKEEIARIEKEEKEKEETIRDLNALSVQLKFAKNKKVLSTEEAKGMAPVVTTLLRYSDIKIEVVGHSCDLGSAEVKESIGLERAKLVANHLLSNGVKEEQITTRSASDREPTVPNTSEEARKKNRRVTFKLVK